MKYSTILIILACLIFQISCQREIEDPIGQTNPPPPVVTVPEQLVTASVIGEVLDETGLPVANVNVSGGGLHTQSASNGLFRIKNGRFNSLNASVKIEKAGYFTVIRTFLVKSNDSAFVRIKLIPLILSTSFNNNISGAVELNGGKAKLLFPANSCVLPSGLPYTGNVKVYATHISPDNPDLALTMPGNLTGITSPSQISVLETYGMLSVELRGDNGELLKISNTKKVKMTVTIPPSLLATAKDSLPMWFFDETKAIWVEEGSAKKTGNTYETFVTHFTFWNYDWPCAQVFLDFTLKDRIDSTPLAYNSLVLSAGTAVYSITNASGYASGYVFKNLPIRLRALNNCGQNIIDTVIGPYSVNTNLGTIYVSTLVTPNYVVRGTMLDCNGQAVSRGSVSVQMLGLTHTVPVAADGSFSIEAYWCGTSTINTTLNGYDSIGGTPITPLPISIVSGQPLNIGFVTSCATLPDQFISYNLDDTSRRTFIRNTDSAFCNKTFVFNRTNLACRKANGTPDVEGFVAFITGPSSSAPTDTSSILTLQRFTTASTPSSLKIISFTEKYSAYPPNLSTPGWVTGWFNCVFLDELNVQHRVKSYFRMWRN